MTFEAGLAELAITPEQCAQWDEDVQAALAAVANDGRFKVQSAQSFLADASIAEDPAQSAIVEHVYKSSDLIDADTFADEPDEAPNDQIPGVLPTAGVGQLFAPSGSGKSFVALKMAADIALGAEFHTGRMARQGAAVYVCAEGARGFKKRVRAIRKHYGIGGFDGRFKILRIPVNLFKVDQTQELVRRIKAALPECTLAIFDTRWRCSVGASEDSADDNAVIFSSAEYIARELKCFCLLIAHTGYDTSRVRGSSAQYAACDVELQVERKGDYMTLRCTKQKDGDSGAELLFKSAVIDLGRNAHEEPESSLVLEPADSAQAAVTFKPEGKIEKAAYEYTRRVGGSKFAKEELVAEVAKACDSRAANVRRTVEKLAGRLFLKDDDELELLPRLIVTKDWLQ